MSEATIPIKELMEKTEQWLLGQGYKKSTLGFYRATWNRFLSYSASPAYSRETAEQFLVLTCTGFMTTNIRIWIIPFNSQTSNALHPRFHRYGVLKKSTRFLQSSILPIQLEGGITRFFNPEFHKYLRRAGIAIPTKRHTGVHTIRHSFATNMLRKGTPVQDVSQILGHSNISVTETYLRVDIEHMRLCSLSLEGLL